MLKRNECTKTVMPPLAGGGHGGELVRGGVDGAAKHHHHHHHHVPPPQQRRRRRRLCLALVVTAGMMMMMIVVLTLSGLYSIRMLLLGAAGESGDVSFLEPTLLEAAAAAAAAATTTTTTAARQESSHSLILRRSPSLSKNNNKKKYQSTDDPDNKLKTKLPNNKAIAAHNIATSSSSNVTFFPPIVTPKSSIKNNNNTITSSCRIGPSSTFRYVGCGYNGQAFAVDCENHHHHHEQRRRRQPKQQQKKLKLKYQQEPPPPFVVVKLLTIPANRSDKKKFGNGRIGMYKSDKPENTLRYRDLYQRLLLLSNTPNTTTTDDDDDDDDNKEKVLRHFALQRGVVNLSPDGILLLKAAASANRSLTMNSPFRGMVLDPLPGTSTTEQESSTQSPPLVIQGKIYGYYKGQSIRVWLRPKEKFDNTSRLFYEKRQYQVIRDLIYVYRHLYRQHILICDLKLDHFLYSNDTNDTTLIDMDEFLYGRGIKARPDRPDFDTYTEQWQQWQLLTVIANVCDYEVQHERERENALLSPAGLASIVCGGKGGKKSMSLLYEAEETWASSFAKCGFDRPMVWSRDMLNHTAATYEALATWSGLPP